MSFLFFAMRSPIIPRAKNIVAIMRSVPERRRDCIRPVFPSIVK